ncbi:MAG: hypothetical protein U0838_17680 [Chloroflexota bacterium]
MLGDNSKGELGDGTTTNRNTPVAVKSVTGAVSLGLGGLHTCAVVGSSKAVKCWGYNGYGQLGDGTTTMRKTAVTTKSLSGVAAVAGSANFTCAVLTSERRAAGARQHLRPARRRHRHQAPQASGREGPLRRGRHRRRRRHCLR